ncbi:MAG: S-methyl-5'-thioadenosine phosphorylase [Aquificota bacterium]|nr:S-methyl-5'-thioadenosine phosphorylase [Aquificota bacterium]
MLGIIGGSGLYSLEGVRIVDEVFPETPFGEPSSPLTVAEVEGRRVVFLARHGKDHSLPPHLVPYRANLWAMRELGVERVLGVSAVGGINRDLMPGDLFIPTSFIDLTRSRERTFYEGRFSKKVEGEDRVARLMREGKVVHVDVSDPYCPEMRNTLDRILRDLSLRYVHGGVYVCTEGPRFETTAEIRMIDKLGGDVVGMTGVPEVVLAKELRMCYASLCVVSNPAAGISENRLTSEEVLEMMAEKEEDIRRVVLEFVRRVPQSRSCPCPGSLEGAEV